MESGVGIRPIARGARGLNDVRIGCGVDLERAPNGNNGRFGPLRMAYVRMQASRTSPLERLMKTEIPGCPPFGQPGVCEAEQVLG